VGALSYTATLERTSGELTCCHSYNSSCNFTELPCGEMYVLTVTAEGRTCNSSQSDPIIVRTGARAHIHTSTHTSHTHTHIHTHTLTHSHTHTHTHTHSSLSEAAQVAVRAPLQPAALPGLTSGRQLSQGKNVSA